MSRLARAGDVNVRFCVEYAKSGRSACKHSKCGQLIGEGTVRLGKITPNPFASGDMTSWYHVDCLFETLQKGRADNEKISDEDDLAGFYELEDADQTTIRDRINDVNKVMEDLENAESKAIYLEDTHGDSEKFWQISVSGATTRVAWGNIGTAGFSQVKDHEDEDAAEDYKEKAVKSKLKIGYKHATKGAYKPKKAPVKSGSGGGGDGSSESGGLDGAEGLRYTVEYAKSGRSKCRYGRCKETIDEGEVRMGKVIRNPFTDSGAEMTVWYHLKCLFDTLKTSRASSIKIRGVDDVEGIEDLKKADKSKVEKLVEAEGEFRRSLEAAGAGSGPAAGGARSTTKSGGAAKSGAKGKSAGKSKGRKKAKKDDDDDEEDEEEEKDSGSGGSGATAYFECDATDQFGRDEIKFWEITISGKATQVRYGKQGEAGFISAKVHGSPAAAAKFHAKMVKEKTGKGYRLVSNSPTWHVPTAGGDDDGGDDDDDGEAKTAAKKTKSKAKTKKPAAKKSKTKKRKRDDDDDDDDEDDQGHDDDDIDYDSMSVAELKEECEMAGLSKSGKKADLIARLKTG